MDKDISLDLMNVMGTLQNTTDTFLIMYNNMGGFKGPMIRQHLRTAYEYILTGNFEKAMVEINLAEQKMHG